MSNMRQIYAIKSKNRKRILEVCPDMKNESGIYFYTRTDSDGINYFYIGQSVDCLDRNISHLTGYQHIDLSIKKRGFYSSENPYGWKLNVIYYPKSELDKWEQYWILEYTKRGYQCRYNKTGGGQGEGKEKINMGIKRSVLIVSLIQFLFAELMEIATLIYALRSDVS